MPVVGVHTDALRSYRYSRLSNLVLMVHGAAQNYATLVKAMPAQLLVVRPFVFFSFWFDRCCSLAAVLGVRAEHETFHCALCCFHFPDRWLLFAVALALDSSCRVLDFRSLSICRTRAALGYLIRWCWRGCCSLRVFTYSLTFVCVSINWLCIHCCPRYATVSHKIAK